MTPASSLRAGAPRRRILVADDSSFMRRMLAQALTEQGFDVVGEAADGDEALRLFRSLRPDAMTLDLAMPGMDGIGVLRRLDTAGRVCPVVVVSAFSPAHGARAVDALAEGAFDLVAKPVLGEPLEPFVDALARKVEAAASAGAATTVAAAPTAPAPSAASAAAARFSRAGTTERPRPRRSRSAGDRVLVIAVSTGGPKALATLVPRLPRTLGAGAYIVQHMPASFTSSLAARLDEIGSLRVVEAAGGEAPDPGTLLVAPGGSHLRVTADGRTSVSDAEPVGGLRPRADLTITDLTAVYGDRVVLVVMTGMGRDGLEGARAVRAAGGRVIVEAESSCTVYGMPRAVFEAGLADVVAPLDELADCIATELR